jgi:predicted MFS family arabinose efflux permease
MLGPFASHLGRKTCLYVAVALIYISNIVMITTENIGGLYAGRLIIGLGNGLLMTFSQLYIQVHPGVAFPVFISLTAHRNARQLDTAASC